MGRQAEPPEEPLEVLVSAGQYVPFDRRCNPFRHAVTFGSLYLTERHRECGSFGTQSQ
jgi:hypothetical protein